MDTPCILLLRMSDVCNMLTTVKRNQQKRFTYGGHKHSSSLTDRCELAVNKITEETKPRTQSNTAAQERK